MSKKPAVALRRPPPVVDPQTAEQFVRGGAAPVHAIPESKTPGKVHGRGPRRSFITRADGRELRRMTVYLPPDLARRLAVYAARTDSDISAAIAAICDDFLTAHAEH